MSSSFSLISVAASARDISRQALASRKCQEPIVTYKLIDHTLNYYTGYQVTTNLGACPDILIQFAQVNPIHNGDQCRLSSRNPYTPSSVCAGYFIYWKALPNSCALTELSQ